MAEKKAQNSYTNESITKLENEERVRSRPEVIFGSNGLEGCKHSFLEILANSIDEAREGYGSTIRVTVFKDRTMEVDDCGRGVPMAWNPKHNEYNWSLIFCELYAGSKYDNNNDAGVYQYSLGTNGLGACSTQYSSEFMEVSSYRDGMVYSMSFKKGKPKGKLKERPQEKKDRKSGTVIRWKPDLEVFTDIAIPFEYYKEVLHRQSVVNCGVELLLKFENDDGSWKEERFYYQNGLSEYVKELAKGDDLTLPTEWEMQAEGKDREDLEAYKFKANISFCLTANTSAAEYYHNSSFLEYGGATEKAARAAFTASLDKFAHKNGKYTKNEAKISFSDIDESLVIVINSASTKTSYENQTKKAINNTFIQKALTDYLTRQLDAYLMETPKDAEAFITRVLANKRARETAEKNKIDIKKTLLQKSSMDAANRVEKFVACRSKDKTKRELYIVEGDSAMSSCKLGRNAEFQAIIPVRGKTLNCMKVGLDRIFKSDIIVDLLRVIGVGAETTKHTKELDGFYPERLSWDKIIICTDADEDGFQIRTLLLTLFYRLLPSLIKDGRVYIAESPLFEITCGEDTYFAYTEEEKEEKIKELGRAKYTVQRSKGLGENEPEMMWQTTMNPATRRLVSVLPADDKETEEIFDTLLGDNLPARKEYIYKYGSFYLAQADL